MRQFHLLKKENSAFGGSLLSKRAERARRRPISIKHSMHIVMRSSRAKGEWSFRRGKNPGRIVNLVNKFARKYGVRVLSMANVGNHLHLHVRLANRHVYPAFIRALTGAIALLVTKAKKFKGIVGKFWDYRPYSRFVESYRDFLNVCDYVRINQMEGFGIDRKEARFFVSISRDGPAGFEELLFG